MTTARSGAVSGSGTANFSGSGRAWKVAIWALRSATRSLPIRSVTRSTCLGQTRSSARFSSEALASVNERLDVPA
jgi:hypothetical protein